jgi:hypothetical protein
VTRDAITLVGVIQLQAGDKPDQGVDRFFDLRVSRQSEALAWACQQRPEIVEDRPVRVFRETGEYKTINVNCVAGLDTRQLVDDDD